MAQVIVYESNEGSVYVCVPTGELPIEQVLAKDCPKEAIIVDESELPTDNFNAWELVNGKVVVNESKKAAIITAKQQSVTAQESALSKLTALGLTADEVKALLGATS
jgi:hypothetical protein